jgi:hypothetical protein
MKNNLNGFWGFSNDTKVGEPSDAFFVKEKQGGVSQCGLSILH